MRRVKQLYGARQSYIGDNMVCDKLYVDGVCQMWRVFTPLARVNQILLDTLYISIDAQLTGICSIYLVINKITKEESIMIRFFKSLFGSKKVEEPAAPYKVESVVAVGEPPATAEIGRAHV